MSPSESQRRLEGIELLKGALNTRALDELRPVAADENPGISAAG
jgi:hypothetical protein